MGLVVAARRLAVRLRRLRQLHGRADAVLFVRVVALAAMVPLLVRLPLPRQAAVLTSRRLPFRRPRTKGSGSDAIDRVARCVDLAQDVARPFVRPGCLTRGITLYWFLGRGDDEVELCFGLGHSDARPDYSGHCWLTRGGQPFLERADPTESFAVVYRIPAASR